MSEEEVNIGEPQPVDLTAFELDQLLSLFVGILMAKAWQYMGLRLTPGKDEVEKDLVKASVAIDCVSFMVDNMAPSLKEEEIASMRAMLADLQLNYAKQS
jgi:hypothetical protein